MKIRNKYIVILLSITLILVSINQASATGIRNRSLVENRGLVFNTGTVSDEVRLLKDFFRARNDANVPWGYQYDARTKELVRNFQRSKGLKADGIANVSTINAINKETKEKNYKIGLREPKVTMKSDLIVINKSSNTLYLFKNGRLDASYPVATGKDSTLTPNGKHKVVVKVVDPYWGGAGVSAPVQGGAPNNPLGKRWIGLSVGGGSVYGIHGNAAPYSIGKYVSMGCVRMFNHEVVHLYDRIKVGTPVWIGDEALLSQYGIKFDHNYSDYKEKVVVPKEPKPNMEKIDIKLDGVSLGLDESAINNRDNMHYPFRKLIEILGGEIKWNNETRTASGVLNDREVNFKVASRTYNVNGEKLSFADGQEALIYKDRTYVPIRVVLESFGYEVKWDGPSRTINIERLEQEENEEEFLEEIDSNKQVFLEINQGQEEEIINQNEDNIDIDK